MSRKPFEPLADAATRPVGARRSGAQRWRSPDCFTATSLAPGLSATRTDGQPDQGIAHPWSRERIQSARRTPLAPLLRRRGYPLRDLGGGNFLVEDHQDLAVKDFYWVWNTRSLKGNAIDFLMLVECRSFAQAMQILTSHSDNREPDQAPDQPDD